MSQVSFDLLSIQAELLCYFSIGANVRERETILVKSRLDGCNDGVVLVVGKSVLEVGQGQGWVKGIQDQLSLC